MRALVVADRPAVRGFLVATVRRTLDSVETTAVADMEAALSVATSWKPEVAVVDVGAAESELRQLCTDLNAQGVRTVIAAASMEEALRLLQAGALGITSPGEGAEGLALTLRAVARGDTHVPSPLLSTVLEDLVRRPPRPRRPSDQPSGPVHRLSRREREVLTLLGEGMGTVEIARRLHISPETAKTHIRHLLHKLGVRSRVEAAAVAADLAAQAEGDL